ncbi:MAG: Gfo/Idh/MocA family oxidoreductase [Phycisphaerales bacterium]|nr:Gfo/Idh/MocA family oxidoreductase [Phycisphaerales bacterium]
MNLGIIMHGVTGRMGANQHLARSIMEIRNAGGIRVGETTVVPDPILVGRNEDKLRSLADQHGLERWSTSFDEALEGEDPIVFDASSTLLRASIVEKAARAGKAVYCEKPTATTSAQALRLARICEEAGVRNGVVQDKLWLPGIVKLKRLLDQGFFGDLLSVRGEFGYWVFTGEDQPAQRPSWNYRAEDGGGIVIDMFCHWQYVIQNLFGPVRRLAAVARTEIPTRIDEQGAPYRCTADDAAYAIFELNGGVIAQFNSSWTTRVRRDDLLTIQVDGTGGSAVAGLRECLVQPHARTPRPTWNPDVPKALDFFEGWDQLDPDAEFPNAFRAQWELFIRHVVGGDPFPWTLREGARGVQLAELGLQASESRTWVDVEPL